MLVSEIKTTFGNGRIRLDGTIQTEKENRSYHVFYDFPWKYGFDLSLNCGDPFLALCLLPAMVAGEALQITAPVSYRLIENINHLQTVFAAMHPDWSKIEVKAPVRYFNRPMLKPRGKRGLFFSLGVDSFYSLQELIQKSQFFPLSHLILVHGFDVFYQKGNQEIFPELLVRTKKVAASCDLDVLDVVTNLRDFSDHYVNWETQYGCGAFSVGLALQRGFDTIYLASGMSIFFDGFIASGSGPLITPHWSTERLVFIQQGGAAERQDKINAISDFSLAMEHLRVCWQNPENVYNCGRCEKCLRTMLGLLLVDKLEKCHTLPNSLPLDLVRQIRIKNPTVVHIYQRLLRELDQMKNPSLEITEIKEILSIIVADCQSGKV